MQMVAKSATRNFQNCSKAMNTPVRDGLIVVVFLKLGIPSPESLLLFGIPMENVSHHQTFKLLNQNLGSS